MSNGMISVAGAQRCHAPQVARLIMMAMSDECCLHFCGKGHGLADFRRMMTGLVELDESQYSYRNTIVALDGDVVAGIAVSYDGEDLHRLRQPFLEAAIECLGKDHTGMDDETQAGELYLDSLAVLPAYRRQGIARRLIEATKDKANRLGLPCVGLLVDAGNATGAAFYNAMGFGFANESRWGGHEMRHLTL